MCNATIPKNRNIIPKNEESIKNEVDKKTINDEDVLAAERRLKKANHAKFYWEDNHEPHVERRRKISSKYPEVKKLFGHNDGTKIVVIMTILLQIGSIHILRGSPWYYWLYCCYTLSGSVNHMMTLAMHELSHNLGCKKMIYNRIWAIIANLPMGIPAAASFRRYHLEHHRYQGEDDLDVDIPVEIEGWFFTSSPRKLLWCFLQPAFYSLRPLFVSPKKPSSWEYINITCCVLFDSLIFYFYGLPGLAYLVFGTLLGMGVHPVAGHFIAEHYVMNKGQETYSYYGPLNWLAFNVGYHNEHHDFPFVSGKNLHKVRQMAPDFYDEIPHYHSWIKVIYDYIMDTKISPYSRTRRVTMSNKDIEKLRARGGLIS